MSLTVKHINADATFLLTFEPLSYQTPPTSTSSLSSSSLGPPDGSFSILCDPWLSGSSQILHPKFSIQDHTVPACVSSVAELPEPDLVLISQNKPDHCHEQTLKQLPALSKTRILAEPNAARRIRSWKHFDPDNVHPMRRFQERDHRPENLVRIPIPALTPGGDPGEVTVALITKKYDLSGLHTAFGITYRPPTASSPFRTTSCPTSSTSLTTPPDSPRSFQSATTLTSSSTNPADRTLSVLFSPHGVSYADIHPYAISHLVTEAALPLTAIFHPFDRVQNPWYLGGNISTGLPGGLEIAQNLLARYWIATHDEEKVLRGISVAMLCTDKYRPEVVRQQLMVDRRGKGIGKGGLRLGTDARVLDVGDHLFMGAWGATI